jgi:ABC-type multidrug transport system ATPase subunit
VQQDDLFIGTMTVREHLSFLAFLKMGRDFSSDEKYRRIEEVITQVNHYFILF